MSNGFLILFFFFKKKKLLLYENSMSNLTVIYDSIYIYTIFQENTIKKRLQRQRRIKDEQDSIIIFKIYIFTTTKLNTKSIIERERNKN